MPHLTGCPAGARRAVPLPLEAQFRAVFADAISGAGHSTPGFLPFLVFGEYPLLFSEVESKSEFFPQWEAGQDPVASLIWREKVSVSLFE